MKLTDIEGIDQVKHFFDCKIEKEQNDIGDFTFFSVCTTYYGLERYIFDTNYCKSSNGWKQYDTHQDASYFGVWINLDKRLIITYCEGDISISYSPTKEILKTKLDKMNEFYGPPPPAFTCFEQNSLNQWTRTEIFNERPQVK